MFGKSVSHINMAGHSHIRFSNKRFETKNARIGALIPHHPPLTTPTTHTAETTKRNHKYIGRSFISYRLFSCSPPKRKVDTTATTTMRYPKRCVDLPRL